MYLTPTYLGQGFVDDDDDSMLSKYLIPAHMLIIQINEFVKRGRDQLVPYYAGILGAVLPCISDKEDKIKLVN